MPICLTFTCCNPKMPLVQADLQARPGTASQELFEKRRFTRSHLVQHLKKGIDQNSPPDAASIAFLLSCSNECFGLHGERTEACKRQHGATLSGRLHAMNKRRKGK